MSSNVRVALVHDWLDRPMGGALRVTLELARLFPDAPVYTLLYNGSFTHGGLASDRVRTSRLQCLPAWLRRHPKYLLPLIQGAVERWDFRGFDVVISSSSAFVKNILTGPTTLHLCYCHSPMRFAWDYWPQYVDEMRLDPVRRMAITAMVRHLRQWDLVGVSRVDQFVANSMTTQARIERYYRRESRVIYPPVAVDDFDVSTVKGDEYVTLATLTPYKRIDLAIAACNISHRKLCVIGDGPDLARLRTIAGPTIRFAGHLSDKQRARQLGQARGLIYANEEDFGIAAVESLAAGTPVVAFRRGGLTEIVEDGRAGLFFDVQTADGLNDALDRLELTQFDPHALHNVAQRFSVSRFDREILQALDEARGAHATKQRSA